MRPVLSVEFDATLSTYQIQAAVGPGVEVARAAECLTRVGGGRFSYMVDQSHGDGVLTVTAGLELFSRSPTRLLVEYSYFRPVLDDPGDGFAFADNHVFQVGLRF